MTSREPEPATTGAQAVDRAARLLTAIVDRPAPMTFTEFVESSGLAKSTTSRLLLALERNGLVIRDESGAYAAGELFARYGWRVGHTSELVVVARPYLERLADLTGETINLGVVQAGGFVQVVDQVDSPHLLGTTNWVGRPVPLHASALGKALLAYHATELPPGRLERMTDRTLTTREVLAVELAEARRRGVATMLEELEVGLVAVATPVFRDGGTCVASLSVSGPAARLGPARLRDAASHCVEQANALSQTLGHHPRREGAA